MISYLQTGSCNFTRATNSSFRLLTMIKNSILIAIGGSIGSVGRYLMSYYVSKISTDSFVVGTFAVNMIGCFIIGIVYGLAQRFDWFTDEYRLLLATGFCGGFTTFSAFAYENLRLLQNQHYLSFVLYTVGSFIIGIFMVWLGFIIAKS